MKQNEQWTNTWQSTLVEILIHHTQILFGTHILTPIRKPCSNGINFCQSHLSLMKGIRDENWQKETDKFATNQSIDQFNQIEVLRVRRGWCEKWWRLKPNRFLIYSHFSSSLALSHTLSAGVVSFWQITLWPYTSIFLCASGCACMPFITSHSIYVINRWIFFQLFSFLLLLSSGWFEWISTDLVLILCMWHSHITHTQIIKCDKNYQMGNNYSMERIWLGFYILEFFFFSCLLLLIWMKFTYTIPMTAQMKWKFVIKLVWFVDLFGFISKIWRKKFDYFCVWPIVLLFVYSISNSLIYIFRVGLCVAIRQGKILHQYMCVWACVWVCAIEFVAYVSVWICTVRVRAIALFDSFRFFAIQ